MTTERTRGVVVGLRVTEPAPTVAFLRDDGTCAFPGVETATARCTVCVRLAGAGDELGAIAEDEDDHFVDEDS